MSRLFAVVVAALAAAVMVAGGAGAGGTVGSGCIAHRPAYVEGVFESSYTAGCSGHDEPELDPLPMIGRASVYGWLVHRAESAKWHSPTHSSCGPPAFAG